MTMASDQSDNESATGLQQVWRERPLDVRRVSLHRDEWQRAVFAEARPELVPDGEPQTVSMDADLATRVKRSHLGIWDK